jgi:hypothetical protein
LRDLLQRHALGAKNAVQIAECHGYFSAPSRSISLGYGTGL